MASKEFSVLNLIGIALAVCIGVLVARLAYAYIVTSMFTQAVETTLEDFSVRTQANSDRAKRNAERQRLQRQQQTERQRLASKKGQDLQRRCFEWSEFVRSTPGEYAIEQRDKACGNLRTYISTGRLPAR